MKELRILNKEEVDNGTMVTYEIFEGDKVLKNCKQLVPTGFERLLIPQLDGTTALSAYL